MTMTTDRAFLRLLSLILAVALAIGMTPMTAFATESVTDTGADSGLAPRAMTARAGGAIEDADGLFFSGTAGATDWELYIGADESTTTLLKDRHAGAAGLYEVRYSDGRPTLVLLGLDFTSTGQHALTLLGDAAVLAENAPSSLTTSAKGKNTIVSKHDLLLGGGQTLALATTNSQESNHGVKVDGALTLEGDGALTVTANGSLGFVLVGATGLKGKSITVDGKEITLTINGGINAICAAGGGLVIQNGAVINVTASGGTIMTGGGSTGLLAGNNVTIEDSSVTLANTGDGMGIYALYDITLTNCPMVDITAKRHCAILAWYGSVTMDASEVEADTTGSSSLIGSAIQSGAAVVVDGGSTVKASSVAGNAILAETAFELKNGTVWASSEAKSAIGAQSMGGAPIADWSMKGAADANVAEPAANAKIFEADASATIVLDDGQNTPAKSVKLECLSRKEQVSISGVSLAAKSYDGRALAPTGTPVAKTENGQTVAISDYLHTWKKGEQPLAQAPKDAGDYQLTISVPESNESYMGEASFNATISKAGVTIKPADQTMTVGGALAPFALQYTGLVQGEALTPSVAPVLVCQDSEGNAVDGSKEGSFPIQWSNREATTFTGPTSDNYTIATDGQGMLTVRAASSGESGGDDSSDDNGGGTGGGSAGGNSGGAAALTPVSTEGLLRDAAKALGDGSNQLVVRNAASFSPQNMKAVYEAALASGKSLTICADTVKDGLIQLRLYIDPAQAAKLTAPIALGGAVGDEALGKRLGQFFANDLRIVSLGQKGDFGMKISLATKLDLTGLDARSLHVYAYNQQKNELTLLENAYLGLDAAGFVHLSTTVGGSLIITDRPLMAK